MFSQKAVGMQRAKAVVTEKLCDQAPRNSQRLLLNKLRMLACNLDASVGQVSNCNKMSIPLISHGQAHEQLVSGN